VVCHDIANALTVLQGEIALAQMSQADTPDINGSDVMSDMGSSRLERMGYACGNIDEIISSVRMLEAVEQGSIAFNLEPVDLRAVFKNAEVIFAERLARRRASIEFPTLAADTRFVMAEPRILANQVFGNLISNAIKFSYPDSRIVVSVSRQGTETTIRVIDQGIGMPADLVARLFDLKAKTSRPGTAGEPGTGFGLRTVKSFVDLFGGQIEIVSRAENEYPKDHGTTVGIRLASAPG
jgi:signal transduction histidine kinase